MRQRNAAIFNRKINEMDSVRSTKFRRGGKAEFLYLMFSNHMGSGLLLSYFSKH